VPAVDWIETNEQERCVGVVKKKIKGGFGPFGGVSPIMNKEHCVGVVKKRKA
jgi:hypothetical protein